MKNSVIKIGTKLIGVNRPVFIIAEAGVNHNGSLKLAKKLIDQAKSVGSDAIKFQTFCAKDLVTGSAPKAQYQKKSALGKTQLKMLEKLELSQADFRYLFKYCQRKKIMFLSTPFDCDSARFLQELGVAAFKVGSGELTNLPLLTQLANYQKPLILSTGMADLAEVKLAVKAVKRQNNKQIVLLHCVSNYPAEYKDINLRAMETLKINCKTLVGYSDHALGDTVALAAVARGALVIEKHFTLSRKLSGPDQKTSLEPQEFKNMVDRIRNIELALGDGVKRPAVSEMAISKVARKSIVAACDLAKGSKLMSVCLAVKRPGTGIAPKYFSKIIGKSLKVNLKKDTLLKWQMFK